jgi:hypothetical protein
MFKSEPYRACLALQRLMLKAAADDKTPASALAQLSRAWCECEDQKRTMRETKLKKAAGLANGPKVKHPRWTKPVEPAESAAPQAPAPPPVTGEKA